MKASPDELARTLLSDARGRGAEAIFVMVAKVWYAEKDARCCRPAFNLRAFGKALGLTATGHLLIRATHHVAAQRRATLGGRPRQPSGVMSAGGHGIEWVTEHGRRVLT